MSGRTRCARCARGAGRTGADTRPAGRFGRNWGCKRGSYVNSLHFETCYYQAIEFAIERGLRQVEAGAQGQETKMGRGYVPRPTFSSHYLPGGGNATQDAPRKHATTRARARRLRAGLEGCARH